VRSIRRSSCSSRGAISTRFGIMRR
jgi:hypothetical protein